MVGIFVCYGTTFGLFNVVLSNYTRAMLTIMNRREFLRATAGGLASAVMPRWIDLAISPDSSRKRLRLAVVADLHHGLAPDAELRLRSFVNAIRMKPETDLVLQMGDFCYSQPTSSPCMKIWREIDRPCLHVLGNHDMDMCDKVNAMRYTGMKARYGSYVIGGYRFIVLDLNHFKKDGKLVSYANGNYFTDNATNNWADPEQLLWLKNELNSSTEPVILISHQPLGFSQPQQQLPPEQSEVMQIVIDAAKQNPKGAVAVCLCGHMHLDRLEQYQGIPCYCVNSASYFWYKGMNPYSNPLYAFMELTPDGKLKILGASGQFTKDPPHESDEVIGRSASISDRTIGFSKVQGRLACFEPSR